MLQSMEATISEDGTVLLKEAVHLPYPCRAIVTILLEESALDAALLSEAALGVDWNRPEEDAAWSHLTQDR